MSSKPLKLLSLVTLALASVACGDALREPLADARVAQQPIRPTDGEGHLGNGYGPVTVESLPSPGDHFRVWWAADGADAPNSPDTAGDGVPDVVHLVASVADQVATHLTARQWRLALSDVDLNQGDFGGDARFDIYLKDQPPGFGDGYYVREACLLGACAGYFVMENDFVGYPYPSVEEAVSVLISHEYFHAVQSAYRADLPGWISEGSATWMEEDFNPDQSDFERLTRYYFREHTRALNDRNRGPQDSFQYGAAIFFYFLALEHSDSVNRRMFELMADRALELEPEDALASALIEHDDTLGDAFARFALFNAFTGTRAVTGQGYPQAERFDEVAMQDFNQLATFNWDLTTAPLSAHYGALSPTSPVSVAVEAIDGADAPPPTLLVASRDTFAATGAYQVIAPGERVNLEGPPPHTLIVANPDLDQTFSAKWLLDLAATYRVEGWEFTVGGDNVFNDYPDEVLAANSTSGQLIYPSQSPFGFNGAYVYGRIGYRW